MLQYWSEARLRIESIDHAANIVRFTGDAFRPVNWSMGWYAENVFEGLSEPGQWYLDRPSGVLYYWPLPDENMEQLEVVAPVARQWVRIEGDYKTGRLVEHVAFRGLTFQYSSWDLDKKLGYSYPQASIELMPGQRLWVGWHIDEGFSTPQSQVVVPAGIYAKGIAISASRTTKSPTPAPGASILPKAAARTTKSQATSCTTWAPGRFASADRMQPTTMRKSPAEQPSPTTELMIAPSLLRGSRNPDRSEQRQPGRPQRNHRQVRMGHFGRLDLGLYAP